MKRVHQYLNREQTNTIGKWQNGGGWRTRKRSKNTSQHKSTSWETHCAVTTFCQNVPQIIIMIIMTAVMINSALLTVIVLAWRDEWHYRQYQNLANQHLCLHSVFWKSPKPEKRKEPGWAFYAVLCQEYVLDRSLGKYSWTLNLLDYWLTGIQSLPCSGISIYLRYRVVINSFGNWYRRNKLQLSVTKTKEIEMGFKKIGTNLDSLGLVVQEVMLDKLLFIMESVMEFKPAPTWWYIL